MTQKQKERDQVDRYAAHLLQFLTERRMTAHTFIELVMVALGADRSQLGQDYQPPLDGTVATRRGLLKLMREKKIRSRACGSHEYIGLKLKPRLYELIY